MKKMLAMAVLIAAGLVLCLGGAAADTADVIGTVLNGYQTTYQMTTEDLIADNGASFNLDDPENHHVIISVSDEGVTFEAEEGSSPQMAFGRRWDDVEGVIDHNQAVHVKFKPTGTNFNFTVCGHLSLELNIGSQNEPYINVMDKNYQEAFEGSLNVEPGNWYHLLASANDNGVLQAAMWKDGDEGNVAYLNLDLFQSFNESNYKATSWELCVSVSQQNSITISNFDCYTFEDFVTEGKVIQTSYNDIQDNGESADTNDFGPSWTINIADNYEVFYNTIYDIKRPQIVATASSEYVGYSLWDLLELSDNASGVATVWFNDDGENNTLVSPTYDAFIVFAIYEEWEWLGAPYLITIDGLWPDPVTDVYP